MLAAPCGPLHPTRKQKLMVSPSMSTKLAVLSCCNKKAGLDPFCEVVYGNFLDVPFPNNSIDGAYAIQATCHTPKLEDVYSEVFRVLKPGALYVAHEWVTTDKYDSNNNEHLEINEIEIGNALPGLRSYADLAETARKVGFEVVEEKDLALPPARGGG